MTRDFFATVVKSEDGQTSTLSASGNPISHLPTGTILQLNHTILGYIESNSAAPEWILWISGSDIVYLH